MHDTDLTTIRTPTMFIFACAALDVIQKDKYNATPQEFSALLTSYLDPTTYYNELNLLDNINSDSWWQTVQVQLHQEFKILRHAARMLHDAALYKNKPELFNITVSKLLKVCRRGNCRFAAVKIVEHVQDFFALSGNIVEGFSDLVTGDPIQIRHMMVALHRLLVRGTVAFIAHDLIQHGISNVDELSDFVDTLHADLKTALRYFHWKGEREWFITLQFDLSHNFDADNISQELGPINPSFDLYCGRGAYDFREGNWTLQYSGDFIIRNKSWGLYYYQYAVCYYWPTDSEDDFSIEDYNLVSTFMDRISFDTMLAGFMDAQNEDDSELLNCSSQDFRRMLHVHDDLDRAVFENYFKNSLQDGDSVVPLMISQKCLHEIYQVLFYDRFRNAELFGVMSGWDPTVDVVRTSYYNSKNHISRRLCNWYVCYYVKNLGTGAIGELRQHSAAHSFSMVHVTMNIENRSIAVIQSFAKVFEERDCDRHDGDGKNGKKTDWIHGVIAVVASFLIVVAIQAALYYYWRKNNRIKP